jgi:hypothetical protein
MFLERLRQLEPKYKDWTIQNLALYIVGLQAIFYLLLLSEFISIESLVLIPAKVISEGQVWRLFTFCFVPPAIPNLGMGLLYLIINWYVFVIISQYLETYWGSFLFNLYCLFVVALTIFASFLVLFIPSDMLVFINPQVFFYSFFFIIFLAFAVLNPEYEMLLFFVLPLKVKYLAMLSCVFYILSFLGAVTLMDKIVMLICVFTFVLFFYDQIKLTLKQRKRTESYRKQSQETNEAMHTCNQCGKSDISDPKLEFRYRNDEGVPICYCNQCRN